MDKNGRLFIAFALFAVFFILFFPPMQEEANVHTYADTRSLLQIPNFYLVIFNLLFLGLGLKGLWDLRNKKKNLKTILWRIFFIAIVGVALGSSYYHLAPSDERLFWDRLAIVTAFMSLLAVVWAERVTSSIAKTIALILILTGIGSVVYWKLTGDIRFYLLVQYFPLILIALLCFFYPKPNDRNLYAVIIFYVLAKLVEIYDGQIFELTHEWISGATLKQVAAAIGVYFAYRKSRYLGNSS